MSLKHFLALSIAFCAPALAPAQTVVYVDQHNTAGIQNGTSWATAFTEIQDGIEAAREAFGGQVWVAQGSYGGLSANNGSVRMRSTVDLYGGFAGDEVVRDQRDPKANVTIIDVIESNGGAPAPTALIGAGDALIDGFTIRHGQGQDGAGMTNIGVSPTIVNCVFTENVASRFGGAVINVSNASPVFRNCIFAKNYAGDSGGAIANTGAAPSVENCTFSENAVGNVGGAIFNVEGGDVFLDGSTFEKNTALEGGGAVFNEGAEPSITACNFFRNSTPKFGGALFNNNGASPLVINCVFAGNSAGDRGGVVTSLNSLFTAINCTFANNTSFNDGSVLFDNNAGTTIFNSIIWYNSEAPFFALSSVTDIHDSNVGGGQDGANNIAAEPQFTDADNDDYSIKATSPSVDAGTANGAPATDINGVERPAGDGVDQGAYESEVVLPPGPDGFQCPVITLSTGKPAPPGPGTLVLLGAMCATLVAARVRLAKPSNL